MKKKDERALGEQRRGKKERETSSKERWKRVGVQAGETGQGTGEPRKSSSPELRPAAARFLATRGQRSPPCRIFWRVFSEPGNYIFGISTHKRQDPLGGQGHSRREVFVQRMASKTALFLGSGRHTE